MKKGLSEKEVKRIIIMCSFMALITCAVSSVLIAIGVTELDGISLGFGVFFLGLSVFYSGFVMVDIIILQLRYTRKG